MHRAGIGHRAPVDNRDLLAKPCCARAPRVAGACPRRSWPTSNLGKRIFPKPLFWGPPSSTEYEKMTEGARYFVRFPSFDVRNGRRCTFRRSRSELREVAMVPELTGGSGAVEVFTRAAKAHR